MRTYKVTYIRNIGGGGGGRVKCIDVKCAEVSLQQMLLDETSRYMYEVISAVLIPDDEETTQSWEILEPPKIDEKYGEAISPFVFYPLSDHHYASLSDPRNTRAQWTGEVRVPLKGEWFLSGAVIQAYRAKRDMSARYHIARIVKVENLTTYRVKEVLPNGKE